MNDKNLPPAFVTYGWCRSAYAVAWSLGQRGIDVHTGDTSPLAMSRFSKYSKSFTKLPDFYTQPERYFEEVCNALKKTGAKVLLPCHEDVEILSKNQDDLPSDVHIAVPDGDTCTLVNDKFTFIERARKNGCPTPETLQISDSDELENLKETLRWPVVIKARSGNSAKGVRFAHNFVQLKEKFTELVYTFNLSKDRWPVIQEYLPGKVISVWALYDRGRYVSSINVEFLRCKEPQLLGTSTFRKTVDNDTITECTIAALNAFNWNGVANLDFMLDAEGNPKLLEINIRLGGATAITFFSGVDYPYLWYLVALGEPLGNLPLYHADVKSRWIIGDCIAFLERIKRMKIKEALEILLPQKNCYHDDFNFRDPVPLLFEGLDYFVKFVKAGGSVNPVTENVIR